MVSSAVWKLPLHVYSAEDPDAGRTCCRSEPERNRDLNNLIRQLRDQFDVSVLLIEHDMKLVMDISDYIYVVNQGTPLADGKPAEVRDNPAVDQGLSGRIMGDSRC